MSFDMHRITLFAAITALVLAGAASADAAPPKKKPYAATAATDRSTVVKHKRHHVAKPQAVAPRQQWPTSWSDGSFSYGGRYRD
jgi:hypothetical protein